MYTRYFDLTQTFFLACRFFDVVAFIDGELWHGKNDVASESSVVFFRFFRVGCVAPRSKCGSGTASACHSLYGLKLKYR